jgi:hypothetical protein
MSTQMKEVTREEFNAYVLKQDVVLTVKDPFPFTIDYKLRNGTLIGIEVDSYGVLPDGENIITTYFILKP